LKEKLTFLLGDQPISLTFDRLFHSFDRPTHQQQTYSPLINLLNFLLQNRSSNINYDPEPEQNQEQLFDAKPMRELNKGRGAMTTSIKTLSTLIPLITCFDCRNQFNEPGHQLEKEQEEMKLKHVTNCIIIRSKSMLIIQNWKEIHFKTIKKLENLWSLQKIIVFMKITN
jgi:hypothetical protein